MLRVKRLVGGLFKYDGVFLKVIIDILYGRFLGIIDMIKVFEKFNKER